MNNTEKVEVTFNKFQALSQMVRALREYHVWPRGMGKSTGLIAFRTLLNFNLFPRVPGMFQAPTFISLLQKTLPTVLEGFERIGWVEERDYVIGCKPPSHWPKPYIYPRKYDYFLSTRTGAGVHLISQDRKGTSNGLSVGWITADEAKLLNKQQIDDEATQTLRGYEKYVGEPSLLYNMMFVTDQPSGAKQKWIHEMKLESLDERHVTLIVNLQERLNRLEAAFYSTSDTKKQKLLLYKMQPLQFDLERLRKDSVYYTEPNVDDVLRALGPRYIKAQKRVLSDYLFYTSILNMRSPQVEGGFYGMYNEDRHTGEFIDYSFIDSFNYNLKALAEAEPWRKDADLVKHKPLVIALDYNSAINNLVVGQLEGKMRVQNHLYVKWPLLLDHVLESFCDYYRNFPCRNVDYIYDHTALQGRNAVSDIVFRDTVIGILSRRGWHVNPIYIGQTASHESRYHYINSLFAHYEHLLPEIIINKSNCPSLLIALENTEVRQGKNGFEKNKKAESDAGQDQAETTHVTDAFDTLVYGELKMRPMIECGSIGELDTIF